MVLHDECSIRVTKVGCYEGGVSRVGIQQIDSDTYTFQKQNPHSDHNLWIGTAKPLRLFVDHYVELISDGNYDVVEYYIRYIRKPVEMNIFKKVNCELGEITHDEIVRNAVQMALENIESPRLQSHAIEITRQE